MPDFVLIGLTPGFDTGFCFVPYGLISGRLLFADLELMLDSTA
jgi:hypothetical protein